MNVRITCESSLRTWQETLPMGKKVLDFPVPLGMANDIAGIHIELQNHLPKDRFALRADLVYVDGIPQKVVVACESFLLAGREKQPMGKRLFTIPVPPDTAMRIKEMNDEHTPLPRERLTIRVALVHANGIPVPTYREMSLD